MKTPKTNLLLALALAALIPAVAGSLAGCNSDPGGPEPGPDAAARMDKAKQMRAIFDKVDGDYDKLTEPDRAEFIKLTGLNAEQAKTWWVTMKYGLGGAPPGKGAGGPK